MGIRSAALYNEEEEEMLMQRLARHTTLCSLAVMFCMTLSQAVWSQQTASVPVPKIFKLYDGFDQKLINPKKWYSQWQCGSPAVMECVREIEDGRLRLGVRGYGTSDSDAGNQFGLSELDLTLRSATSIATGIMIRGTTAQGCAGNPGEGAHGQALLYGAFFNGGGMTPADDVQAFLQFDRYSTDPAGLVLVGGFLLYQGQFFGNINLGQVNVGERAIVELGWDQPNHRFVATLIRPVHNTIAVQYMPYTVSDTTPAVAPFKGLSARAFSPNCVETQTFAAMEVLFDNVSVGQ